MVTHHRDVSPPTGRMFFKGPRLLSSPRLSTSTPAHVPSMSVTNFFFFSRAAFKLVCLSHLQLWCYFHRSQFKVNCMLIQIWDRCPSQEIVDAKQLEPRSWVRHVWQTSPKCVSCRAEWQKMQIIWASLSPCLDTALLVTLKLHTALFFSNIFCTETFEKPVFFSPPPPTGPWVTNFIIMCIIYYASEIKKKNPIEDVMNF